MTINEDLIAALKVETDRLYNDIFKEPVAQR